MKHFSHIFIFTIISFALLGCGAVKPPLPPPTENQAVAQSESDKNYFDMAIEANDVKLCEKIEFSAVRKTCIAQITQ